MSQDKHHRNDVYGKVDDRSEEDAGVVPAIPAATVVLLRDRDDGPEVLMLRKNSKITFGGMWVFPGGRIDPADYPANGDLQAAARAAAAREATEEANVYLSPDITISSGALQQGMLDSPYSLTQAHSGQAHSGQAHSAEIDQWKDKRNSLQTWSSLASGQRVGRLL